MFLGLQAVSVGKGFVSMEVGVNVANTMIMQAANEQYVKNEAPSGPAIS